MNIFVIGTGRCGTMTFNKACNHISNYTNEHEGNTSKEFKTDPFYYPDNHIEVDARMSYFLPTLIKRYPNALFVHLQRNKKDCIKSLAKRQSLINYGQFHLGTSRRDLTELATIYYENTNKLIKELLRYHNYMHIWLENITLDIETFLFKIDAECDLKKVMAELKIKHNKS